MTEATVVVTMEHTASGVVAAEASNTAGAVMFKAALIIELDRVPIGRGAEAGHGRGAAKQGELRKSRKPPSAARNRRASLRRLVRTRRRRRSQK